MSESARVHAVVVSYRSDPERLALQFERLLQQVSAIVWVDTCRYLPGVPVSYSERKRVDWGR